MKFSNLFKRAVPAASLAAASAMAGPVIETNSFRLTLPEGWITNLKIKPAEARGPAGELLQLSSYSIPSEAQGEEAKGIRGKVLQNAITSMNKAAETPPLKITSPLAKSELANGGELYEITSESPDGRLVFTQYAVIGPHNALLFTLESSVKASAALARQSLNTITWSQP